MKRFNELLSEVKSMNKLKKLSTLEIADLLEANIEASATDPNHPYNLQIKAVLIERQLKRGEPLNEEQQEFYNEWVVKNGSK